MNNESNPLPITHYLLLVTCYLLLVTHLTSITRTPSHEGGGGFFK